MDKREQVKAFYGESLPWAIDEEDRIYAFPEYFYVKPAFMQNIRHATKEISVFFQQIKQYFCDEQAKERIDALMDCLFIDDRLREFVRIDGGAFFSPMARIDFAYHPQTGTFHLLEVNADTPCLFVEAFKATDKAIEHYCQDAAGKEMLAAQTNYDLTHQIGAAFSQIFLSHIKNGWKSLQNTFVFSACDDCLEDRETAIYLKEVVERHFSQAENFRCLYVPLADLLLKDGFLYADKDGALVKVDMLYRLYPLEFLIEDRDENGRETGKALLNVYRDKHLILANPPSAFLYQTKYMQSFIFDILLQGKSMAENSRWKDHGDLFGYFLPTGNSVEELAAAMGKDKHREDFHIVAKPALGREGSDIEIFSYRAYCDNREEFLTRHKNKDYIYQLYTETIKKKVGYLADKEYDVIFSCFVLNGEPSAVVCRLSEGVTTQANCQFMPVVERF